MPCLVTTCPLCKRVMEEDFADGVAGAIEKAEKQARSRMGQHLWSKHVQQCHGPGVWERMVKELTVQGDWVEAQRVAAREIAPPPSLGGVAATPAPTPAALPQPEAAAPSAPQPQSGAAASAPAQGAVMEPPPPVPPHKARGGRAAPEPPPDAVEPWRPVFSEAHPYGVKPQDRESPASLRLLPADASRASPSRSAGTPPRERSRSRRRRRRAARAQVAPGPLQVEPSLAAWAHPPQRSEAAPPGSRELDCLREGRTMS